MKTFKEITAILTGAILLFWGLTTILTAELLNGVIIIGVLLIASGIGCFVYIAKGILKEGK